MKEKVALIVSLNFRVAHVAHLVASYRQMTELGYNSLLYVNAKLIPFIPSDVKYITNLKDITCVDIAFFWFPSIKNISLMLRLKFKYSAKIIYVFHEPAERLHTYKELGFSKGEIAITYVKYFVSTIFIILSDAIILPSHKAFRLYNESICKRINNRVYEIPLLFSDERPQRVLQRKYFSYIGTIAQDHAFDEFIRCIVKLFKSGKIPNGLKFLIATRNNVPKNNDLDNMIESGHLIVQEGNPLTDTEINDFYMQSYVVWNAYNRTTQSGVLAKASMFGTPAIVKTENLSEFAKDGYNVKAVKSNIDMEEILNTLRFTIDNFDCLSANSRYVFEKLFFYRNHNTTIQRIISEISE